MAEFSQPASLERLVFLLRSSGMLLLLLGTAATLAAGYFAGRLKQELQSEVRRLETEVRRLQAAAVPTPPAPVAGRQITERQHEQLVQTLTEFEGSRVNVVSAPEFEPGAYAHALIKTLRTAGLDVRVNYFPDTESIAPGLHAYWSPVASDRAHRIVAALEAAGVAVAAKRGSPRGAVLEFHVGRTDITVKRGEVTQTR